jgi:hypothetical protein
MSYDYNFPESLRIAEINNNRKVGTIDRKYIQSGNNIASGFARPEPFPLGSPAMGGGLKKMGRATKHGITRLATDPAGFAKVLVGAPVTSSNFKGDPDDPFKGGGLKKMAKKASNAVINKATPIVSKAAAKYTEKVLNEMLKSSAEDEAVGSGMSGGKRGAKAFAKKIVSHPAVKKMASEAVQVVAPMIKEVANNMMRDVVKSMSEGGEPAPAGGSKVGKAFKKVGKSVGKIAADVAPVALPLAFGALATATGNPEFAIPAAAMGAATGQSLQKQYGAGLKKMGKKVGKSVGKTAAKVGTAAATQYLVNYLTNPAVDEAVAEGAMVALGRPRGRPRKMVGGAAQIYGAHPMMGSNPATYTPRQIGGMVSQRDVTKRLASQLARSQSAGGAGSGGARSGGARGAIVKKIMRERGVSLPQASSIVKSEGLY